MTFKLSDRTEKIFDHSQDMYASKSQMIDPNQIHTRRKDGTLDVATINREPSLTQQQFKDDSDINNIMRKHGHDPAAFQALTRQGGQYADFSQITDYQDMLETVRYADNAFNSLPAEVRKKFNNNPAELLTFVQDPSNLTEAISLGLTTQKLPQTSNPQTHSQTSNSQTHSQISNPQTQNPNSKPPNSKKTSDE